MFLIRLSKYFYIDSTVILILFAAYCTGNLANILILYTGVMLHEAAHFIACLALGVKVTELKVMPYGVNLNTEFVKNPLHTVIISGAGPLASLLLASLVSDGTWYGQTFKTSNILIFALNVFPALPLDGGGILEGILAYSRGYINAHRYMIDITRVVSGVFMVFGIIFVIISKYNISLLVISGFLMYNLRVEYKKFIFLRKMIYTKEFDRSATGLRIKHRAVLSEVVAVTLAENFGYNYICHFFVYDENMNFIGTLTQSEIIDGTVKYGSSVTVGFLLNGGENERKGKGIQNIAKGV